MTRTLLQSVTAALADRYRLEREVGRGGMATVYLAEDLKHGRRVAIKVLDPEVASAIGSERFLREIEIVARLTHPHILPLHDSGAAGGELYYVTPFIEGETLRARMSREGQLPIEDALRLTREIANGLGHAHHRGLVHRDIKPENVLLSDGIALVADFGIARPTSAAGIGMTIAGAPMGTPLYMAPEQIVGSAEIDARADLYSMGCVLYEMLAGRPPFDGTTSETLAYQHLAVDPRPITDLRPDVPPGLVAVLARALAKNPADRFATAARFAEALGVSTTETLLPASRPTVTAPNNLPRDRTSFVGREGELAVCARLLGESRLLTIIGVGGCGKTRLALRLAETLLDRHPDGVWFVDLAPIPSPERVPESVAAVLNIKAEAGTPLSVTIARRLEGKRTLILLDNCEHLLAACLELLDPLLSTCPDLRVLATSREALGVEGERPFAVRSLSVPRADVPEVVAEAAASEAVRLFVERARVLMPELMLDAGTAPRIVEICRRLDGIPLAIELAAARTKVLSLEQICARLDDRFRLLTGGNKALPRHQTLLATLQWSYDHLDEEMRRLFETLAVFSGGWTLAAAAAVMGEASDEFEILDLMSSLVDKSLVLVGREGKVARYRMLETMRQFAQDQLSKSGNGDAARGRHLDHYLALAEEAEAHLHGSDQGEWFRNLDHELENILAAHAWAEHAVGGGEKSLRMAGALRLYWIARGHFDLGLRTTREALRREPTDARTPSRGRALASAGLLAHRMGDQDIARGFLEESLSIYRFTGDRSGMARALSYLGVASFSQGDPLAAHQHLEEAVAIAQGIDKATALNSLALVVALEGDPVRGSALYREAIGLSKSLHSPGHTAANLHNLAITRMLVDDFASARVHVLESFDLVESAALLATLQGLLEIVAGLAVMRGEPERAARWWGAAEALLDRIGSNRGTLNERVLIPMLHRMRDATGQAPYAAAYAGGRILPTDLATAEARVWLDAAVPPN